jgi:SOS-response transcriptional repressor LexA
MGTADESGIYRDLMRFRPEGLTANAWAVKAGVSRTVWSDMRRHGNPSRRTLEKLLTAAGSSLAEFEALRIDSPPASGSHGGKGAVGEGQRWAWRGAPLPSIPLLPSSLAGEWGGAKSGIEMMEIRPGECLDTLPRPASLAGDRDAYAVTVVGDSMWPRFRPGRRIAVSPRSPVAIGDDVLVLLRNKGGGSGGKLVLLKELVKRTTDRVELRQFNPDVTFSVDTAEVEALHKASGELI